MDILALVLQLLNTILNYLYELGMVIYYAFVQLLTTIPKEIHTPTEEALVRIRIYPNIACT